MEWASLDDACALSDGDELTGGQCGILLNKSEGPMNLEVGRSGRTKAEMHDGLTKQAHDPFPGNIIPRDRIDSIARNVLSYLSYVKPNANPGAGFAPWTNNYQVLQVENDVWQNAMVKVDYNLNEANYQPS